MKKMAAFAFILLAALSAQAGQQILTAIAHPNFEYTGNFISVSGVVKGRAVKGAVKRVAIEGDLNQFQCLGVYNPCYGLVHNIGADIVVDIYVDKDQDGNIDDSVKNMPIATTISSGQMKWIISPQATFVQERYSWLEKIEGQQDREFISLKLSF